MLNFIYKLSWVGVLRYEISDASEEWSGFRLSEPLIADHKVLLALFFFISWKGVALRPCALIKANYNTESSLFMMLCRRLEISRYSWLYFATG